MKLNYEIEFDWRALGLFAVLLLPTIVWIAFPPSTDPLAKPSQTLVVDVSSAIAQVLMIAALVCLRRKGCVTNRKQAIASVVCIICYLLCWVAYYAGLTHPVLFVLMAVLPCLAFASYALARTNYIALSCCLVFFLGHLYFAIVNYCI